MPSTYHFAYKYQRIWDGPSKTLRKVDILIELLHFSWEWYQLLPPRPPGASWVSWVPPGASWELPGSVLGASWEKRALRDSSENTRAPYYVVSSWNAFIIRKKQNPGFTEKSRFWLEISGRIHFSTENLISSYGHDEHFGKGVCPKPILKVWFWMKTFSMSM